MAFVLPTFNLTADVYTSGDTPGVDPPRITIDCQLRAPSVHNMAQNAINQNAQQGMILLTPPGTDLRDNHSTPGNAPDVVEVPPGSGRIYVVQIVDDIGKGFPNEHRFAILYKPGFAWPVPIP